MHGSTGMYCRTGNSFLIFALYYRASLIRRRIFYIACSLDRHRIFCHKFELFVKGTFVADVGQVDIPVD